MRLRSRLLKSKLSQERAIEEIGHFDKKGAMEMRRLSKLSLEGVAKSLKKVEEKMLEVISIDQLVRAIYELITSVRGSLQLKNVCKWHLLRAPNL